MIKAFIRNLCDQIRKHLHETFQLINGSIWIHPWYLLFIFKPTKHSFVILEIFLQFSFINKRILTQCYTNRYICSFALCTKSWLSNMRLYSYLCVYVYVLRRVYSIYRIRNEDSVQTQISWFDFHPYNLLVTNRI